MKIVEQGYEILSMFNKEVCRSMIRRLELAGRTCYKSEKNITDDSASKFVTGIVSSGHHSVIEHINLTVKFITDRGVTHELVRHRLAAYSQESTRYCNYSGKEMEFILPVWFKMGARFYDEIMNLPALVDHHTPPYKGVTGMNHNELGWCNAMQMAEMLYKDMVTEGWSPQQARSILPNSLKTEIVMTTNLREWRHVLKLRTSKAAHPQIRELMLPLAAEFQENLPEVFGYLG